ncbi:hypothetical protein [Leifsonia sp. RAF41]|uniref:hypothetical protein n=1 Tax=Leifsonia sp. RAF41 TaxID=3233056 RepID=UPI003F9C6323
MTEDDGGADTEKSEQTADTLSAEIFDRGASLVLALINFPEWIHRKVESVSFLAGKRGRRRVSLDCTPPALSWAKDPTGATTSIYVPLTLMSKGVLRDLDVSDDTGRALPVLSTAENAQLAASALAFLVKFEHGVTVATEYWARLNAVVSGSEPESRELAQVIVDELKLDVLAAGIFLDLASNFILATVLPATASNVRTVLKYSSHWEAGIASPYMPWWKRKPSEFWTRLRAGTGHKSIRLWVSLYAVEYVDSYHLEVNAPDGLLCSRIEMPPDKNGNLPLDTDRTPVGHVHAHYDPVHRPAGPAVVRFALDQAGPLGRTALIAGSMCVLFAIFLFWPSAQTDLREGLDAATTLLLFVPALLIALNARGVESEFVRWFLLPLRVLSGGLSIVLVIAGGLLVMRASDAVNTAYWWAALVGSAAVFVLTFSGLVRLKVGAKG